MTAPRIITSGNTSEHTRNVIVQRSWDRPYPEFTYSASMERRRRECARAHFHHVFTAHRGWNAAVGTDAWLAYRLKSAQPLAMTMGIAVHEAALRCVRALVAGESLPSVDALYAGAALALNERWTNGRDARQEFWRRPKGAPLFLESLYRVGPSPTHLLRTREKLHRVLTNLVACDDVWAWIRNAKSGDVHLVDPFYRFPVIEPVSGILVPCYAAPDLLVRPHGQRLHLIDWKSGNADGVVDQLLTYALAARDGLSLNVADGCVGVIVALDASPGERITTIDIADADIADAAAQVHAGIRATRALLADPLTNHPHAAHMFPMTTDSRRCGRCAYRALCHPHLYALTP